MTKTIAQRELRNDNARVIDEVVSGQTLLVTRNGHWDAPDVAAALPDQTAISAITLAELAAGPHLAMASDERARRQARLQLPAATARLLPQSLRRAVLTAVGLLTC